MLTYENIFRVSWWVLIHKRSTYSNKYAWLDAMLWERTVCQLPESPEQTSLYSFWLFFDSSVPNILKARYCLSLTMRSTMRSSSDWPLLTLGLAYLPHPREVHLYTGCFMMFIFRREGITGYLGSRSGLEVQSSCSYCSLAWKLLMRTGQADAWHYITNNKISFQNK